ncbi:tetratricopeptide repeat protein [Planctomicrobium sp. SH661]|uniref:tetratricopeptide repeat protein n=1 Tax=Planctomicrobium sp. SH661 TaxID=3448124 RepID=UPI003F5C86B3
MARCTLALLLSSGMAVGSGCGSMSSLTRKEQVKEELDNNPKYSIAGVQGPTERNLSKTNWERKRAELLKHGDEATTRALQNYDDARALYDQGKYAEAEKGFKSVVKERRDLHEGFMAKFRRMWGVSPQKGTDLYSTYGDAIEEDSLYMVAECQYAQRKYPDAEKSYQELLVKYPSTRYLDPVTRQLFRIARYWLDFPEDVGATGDAEIKMANHEAQDLGNMEQPIKKASATTRVPVLPNLTDETRPLFDTYGRGKQALRSIWLHDATGPLADDALMLAANHALRTEDFVEAARLYALLREQYPDSRHLKDAYLLGSHVTLASYMGPAYDGKSLETSRELKQEMLALFPDLTPEQREQLTDEVNRLQEAEVARLWDLVEFYNVKRMNPAVKLHCYLIINRHPDSKYAEMARKELQRIEQKELAWESSIWNLNKKPRQAPPEKQAAAPQATPGKVTLPPAGTTPAQTPPPEKREPEKMPEPPAKPSLLQRMNPLRRAEQPPKLEPIEEDKEEVDPNKSDSQSDDTPLRASFEGK